MNCHLQPPSAHQVHDLQVLSGLVRERESALLLLLEERGQRQWENTEWFLKGCEYQEKESRISREIRSIVFRWILAGEGERESSKDRRSFWVKVKMVIKMSLERIKTLGLLDYTLFNRFEQIIEGVNVGYDRAAGISHFR